MDAIIPSGVEYRRRQLIGGESGSSPHRALDPGLDSIAAQQKTTPAPLGRSRFVLLDLSLGKAASAQPPQPQLGAASQPQLASQRVEQQLLWRWNNRPRQPSKQQRRGLQHGSQQLSSQPQLGSAAQLASAPQLGSAAQLASSAQPQLASHAALFAAAIVVAVEQVEQAAAMAAARITTTGRLTTTTTGGPEAKTGRSAVGAAEHHKGAQDKRRKSKTSVHRETPK